MISRRARVHDTRRRAPSRKGRKGRFARESARVPSAEAASRASGLCPPPGVDLAAFDLRFSRIRDAVKAFLM